MQLQRFIIVALLSLVCAGGRGQVPLTLSESQRPKWLADEGLVMAGSWEPLPFRVRRDGGQGFTPSAEQVAAYQREHSPEMLAQLKSLGVNFIMMHCYKGGGLELERESMADATRFAKRCRDARLHVGVYAYSGAFIWEPLLKEIPTVRDWFLLDERGQPINYYEASYRYYWNRNHPEAIDIYKGIIRFAVQDIQADLIHLDNYILGPGYDLCSQQRFRDYLSQRFSGEQLGQMDVRDVSRVTPPKSDHPNALLRRVWQDFCSESLADSYAEMCRYARTLRKDVLMECNPGGLRGRTAPPVDHGRLLMGGEAFWCEGFMRPMQKGRLDTNISSYKFSRRMNNMMFRYTRSPLEMAEAMAFNLDCLGCLCWFEYGQITDYPGSYGKPLTPDREPFVRFYRNRRELFRNTNVVADVAVLRSFPSQVFGPAERGNTAARVDNELTAKRLCFQPICDAHLAELSRYRVLVLADCPAMSDAQVKQVREFVSAGGRLCVIDPLATHDEWMLPRKNPALDDLPADRVIRVAGPREVPAAIEQMLQQTQSLKVWAKNAPTGSDSTSAEDGLFGLCTELTARDKRQFVHLVNYRETAPMEDLVVRLRVAAPRRVRSVGLASPETDADAEVRFTQEGEFVTFGVPKVGIYTVAVVAAE